MKPITPPFRRAGIIRVDTIAQLFNCAEALGKMNRPLGGNLAIITNAGGPGVMAVDAFSKWELEPADLTRETIGKLERVSAAPLEPRQSRGHPGGRAAGALSRKRSRSSWPAPEVSGVVIILSPQAMTDPTGVAQAMVPEIKKQAKPIFAVWMGAQDVAEGIQDVK